ncbi:MAG: hypothetical protein GWN94_24775 [Phycisphaerae bacterium]|nr:hypothetical protein [Phycisphaerae bacterium]NIP55593.1 hypothetical protein [Phycisphaerae bacterium]NIS54269.1 hypothetical protein [Phycisphaerae bacterium]NIX31853.1 hypothetical protein [Phycisphaerae bacterium]
MAEFTRKMMLVFVVALSALFIQTADAAEPNTIEIDVYDNVVYLQNLTTPMGTETLRMTGRMTVHVVFEGTEEGLADDDDGDWLDEVDTEIVELNLRGNSPMFGAVHMCLRTGLQSDGEMEETTDSRTGVLDVPPFGIGTVNSFFDIYFDFEIAGQRFYNIAELHWEGELSEKPAGRLDNYVHVGTVQLLDENGNPTPYYLETGRVRPNPVVEIDEYESPLCEIRIVDPGGQSFKIPMVGRTVERVFFEGADEGTAYDDEGDLLDEVNTEMPALDFSGYHWHLGHVVMRLDSRIPSLGEMEERVDHNTGTLDVPPFFKDGVVESFFDVSFEISLPGQLMYGRLPLRWLGTLWHKPAGPLTVYENLVDVDLVDAGGAPTGFTVSASQYRPNPFIEVDHFDTSMATIEFQTPSGEQFTVEMMGASTIKVFFEKDFEGSAGDDDNDFLDEVVAELLELDLSGVVPKMGEVRLGLDRRVPTLGEIEENADDKTGRLDIAPFLSCGTAQSHYYANFELVIEGIRMYPERAPRWQAVVKEKPVAPGDVYENLEGVKLVDSDGFGTGYTLMTLRLMPRACGSAGYPYPPGDANHDCRVNLLDVAIVGLHWLECTRPDCY